MLLHDSAMKWKIKKQDVKRAGKPSKARFLSRPDFSQPSITDQTIHMDLQLHKKTSQDWNPSSLHKLTAPPRHRFPAAPSAAACLIVPPTSGSFVSSPECTAPVNPRSVESTSLEAARSSCPLPLLTSSTHRHQGRWGHTCRPPH